MDQWTDGLTGWLTDGQTDLLADWQKKSTKYNLLPRAVLQTAGLLTIMLQFNDLEIYLHFQVAVTKYGFTAKKKI